METERENLSKEDSKPRPPLFDANCLSHNWFAHLNKMMDIGGSRPYQYKDLFAVSKDFTMEVYPEFKAYLNKELSLPKQKPFLFMLFNFILGEAFLGGLLYFISSGMQVATPILIRLFLIWLQTPDPTRQIVWKGYMYAGLLGLIAFLKGIMAQRAMEYFHSSAMRMVPTIAGFIIDKISNITPSARKFINVGNTTNFLTTDIRGIQGVMITGSQLLVAPLLILIFTGMIIYVVGWLGLVVIFIILFSVPFQVYWNKKAMEINARRLVLADKRAKLVSEIITGIKNIKFNTWEAVMIKNINEIRVQEKKLIVTSNVLKGVGDAFAKALPPICSIVVIWIYNASNDVRLNIADTFYIITLFNLMVQPINMILFALISLINALLSAQRVQKFLKLNDSELQKDEAALKKGEIRFENASFGWFSLEYSKLFEPEKKLDEKSMGGEKAHILKKINMRVDPGELVAVVGKVGSGKTSLILSCMHEMICFEGSVKKSGRFAYIPQEAFLLNETMKKNIIFGHGWDEALYRKSIELSQLQQDINELPGGDETEIGERGINLSGGQKQRVLIARAIYSQADIVLIDDSLSALDAYVGKKVLDGVFCGIMKEKTRLLVTHHLHLLEDSRIDKVAFIQDGRLEAFGPYLEVAKNQGFQEYCRKLDEAPDKDQKEEIAEKKKEVEVVDKKAHVKLQTKVEDKAETEIAKGTEEEKREKGVLTKEEVKFEGMVPGIVYLKYFKSGNAFVFIIAILFYASVTFLNQVSAYWAGKWAEYSYSGLSTDTEYGLVYLVIILAMMACLILRSYFWGLFGAIASFNLFKSILWNVLRRPMSFFDTTPNGVIMNRCNDDIFQVDFQIPMIYAFLFEGLAIFIVTFVLLMSLVPYLLIILFFLAIIFYFILRKYVRTSIEIRRLSQLAVSPLLNRVSEMIGGVVSIRAYNKTGFMRDKYSKDLDRITSTQYHERLSSVWINFKLEIIVSVLVVLTPFLIAMVKTEGLTLTSTTSLAAYGTILTNIFVLGSSIPFLIFSFSEVTKGMSSVQRLIEYIEYKEHERDWEFPKAPINWPSKGEIEFKNLHIRYRPKLPLVLKGLDFRIGSHQKIGIVGRTGSGKSTILLSLLRILEGEEDPKTKQPLGSIEIDGVVIDKIGLHELRKNIVVIPQDPFLIQGTLKFNMDPFKDFSDDEILTQLRTVQILDSIRTEDLIEQRIKTYKEEKAKKSAPMGRPGAPPVVPVEINEVEDPEIDNLRNMTVTEKEKMEFLVDAGGANLSVGQRQLICIARSLIRKPKILLMDEATANIDQKTDAIIQKVIKSNMDNTTVITIAHRLITIVQYDKLLILEDGVKKEEGSPLDLIKGKGYFHKLIAEGGEAFEKKMYRLAEDKSIDPNSI